MLGKGEEKDDDDEYLHEMFADIAAVYGLSTKAICRAGSVSVSLQSGRFLLKSSSPSRDLPGNVILDAIASGGHVDYISFGLPRTPQNVQKRLFLQLLGRTEKQAGPTRLPAGWAATGIQKVASIDSKVPRKTRVLWGPP